MVSGVRPKGGLTPDLVLLSSRPLTGQDRRLKPRGRVANMGGKDRIGWLMLQRPAREC